MKLPFTIFKKNSASPTMVIKCKDPRGKWIVCKVWYAKDRSLEARGLDYENSVYAEKIDKILDRDSNAPLVKYHGYGEMNGVELGEFIGIKGENFRLRSGAAKAMSYWHLCCALFIRDTAAAYHWDIYNNVKSIESSKPYVRNYYPLKDMKFKFITLEYISYNTFFDYIDTRTTKEVLGILKQIVEAVYLMYTNKVVHNDLHGGNILVTKDTKKVRVFDFDRAYMKGKDNPQLNSDFCSGLCSSSQCNIYNGDGYAIDFYKMFSYVAVRSDFGVILDAFGVLNRANSITDKHTLLKSFFNRASRDFFSKLDDNNEECTYLQNPNTKMGFVRSAFGKIDEIRRKTRDSARFGRTAVVSKGVLPTTATRVGKGVDTETPVDTKDKPITKAKPLPRARSIADIILDNQLRKYGKAKRRGKMKF